MADTTVSAVETALENQRIGSLQIRVVILCTLIQICDGYDLNAIAWAAPSLIKGWGLTPPGFTMAFLWSSIGIMIGALTAGPLGDRFGLQAAVGLEPDDLRPYRLVSRAPSPDLR